MKAILKLVNNDPPGTRCMANTAVAGSAAREFDIEVVCVIRSEAGPDAKAPAVYLNDKVLSEIGGIRDGKMPEDVLAYELEKAGIPKKKTGGCSYCCGQETEDSI